MQPPYTSTNLSIVDEQDDFYCSNESKEVEQDYTKMATNYILIENKPSEPPATYTFPTLNELHTWTCNATGKTEASVEDVEERVKSELLTKITAFLGGGGPAAIENKKEYDEAYELCLNTLQTYHSSLSENPKLDPELKLFYENKMFQHFYATCTLILATRGFFISRRPDNVIADFVCKKKMYSLPDGFIFSYQWPDIMQYVAYVKLLYKLTNKILPELAFQISCTFGNFERYMQEKPLCDIKPNSKTVEKFWLTQFLEVNFIKEPTGSTKRTDFIEMFNNYLEEFRKLDPTFGKDYDFSSPEKVLGLQTVRRAPGMFIVGYVPVSAAKQTQITSPPILKKTICSRKAGFCGPYQEWKISNKDDIRNNYGYTNFRINQKDIENFEEVELNIGGFTIDKVYPSIQKETNLFEFTRTYVIPSIAFHEILIIVKTKNKMTDNWFTFEYDVVELLDNVSLTDKRVFTINTIQYQKGYYGEHEFSLYKPHLPIMFKGKITRMDYIIPSPSAKEVYLREEFASMGENGNFASVSDPFERKDATKWSITFNKPKHFSEERNMYVHYKDTTQQKYTSHLFAYTERVITIQSGLISIEPL